MAIRSTHVVAFLFVSAIAASTSAGDWPQWRGPEGTGVSRERNLPITWNNERGILWRTELPEWGDSTPCIWGDAIFVTTQHDDNLLLLRINKADGKIVWTQTVGSGSVKRSPIKAKSSDERREQKFHDKQNMASPSPVTNGKVVVAHFGNGDLAAYDFDGHQLWHRNLQDDYGHYTVWWGHANSPVIYGKFVISVCMQDSLADIAMPPVESYLVAHDLLSGRERWRTVRATKARAEECDAYTTPLLTEIDGHPQLIVMGGNQVDGYDPADGKQLWYLPDIKGGRTVTGPTIADGLLYVTQGKSGPMLAIKLSGMGELSRRDVVWRVDQGTPDSSTPVVWENHLFTINDGGIARAYDAHSGRSDWVPPLRLKGDYKASPIAAEGRIYFLNTHGLCTVVSATSHAEKLAENEIDDETLASPAVSDGRIYFRGRKALWCVGKDF
ncbi:MAG TPA: PQQ-binding-like beta-propeller repeat protein [Pirellulales bacterium]